MKLAAPPKSSSVLKRARRYVQRCPPAVSGQHGHRATFRVACVLVHGFALPPAEALAVLREWNLSCQPPWSETELCRKVTSAAQANSRKPHGYLINDQSGEAGDSVVYPGSPMSADFPPPPPVVAQPGKPKFLPALLRRVAALLPHVDETFVKERSPYCPETQTPVTFLRRLYRVGECVLVFDKYKSQGLHVCEVTAPPSDAAGLDHLVNGCPDGVWFQCNPVDGKFHPNPRQEGKPSRRSEESVTDWRYLVLESDQANTRDWLAALVQMPLPIAAIYTSGGRSIHALVRLDAKSKLDWDARAQEIKALLTVLGADPAAMTAVRLTRLPGCHRGQTGPPAPKIPPVRKRRVDEPLEYDAAGNPVWTIPDDPPPVKFWTGGQLQELLYLNSEPDIKPIFKLPTRRELHAQWLASFNPNQETM